MTRFLFHRLMGLILVLLALTASMFVLQRFVPGDPVRAQLGPGASEESVAAKREELGLDKPIYAQLLNYVGGLLRGNLGQSIHTDRPVSEDVGDFAPASMELIAVSTVFMFFVAMALGVAGRRPGWRSTSVRVFVLGLGSAPIFLIGIGGLIVFFWKLGWLPAQGRGAESITGPTGLKLVDTLLAGDAQAFVDALRHLLLPAFCLAIPSGVAVGRVLRSSLLGVYRQDYVRTARAKGLDERGILRHHALRNASVPALGMAGLQWGLVLANLVIVETIFSWPGLGLYLSASIGSRDFPAILGVSLLLGAGYVIINAVVDLLQAMADPRIRTI